VPWINHIKFSTVVNTLQQVMEKNRVRFPRVRSPQQDDVCIFNLAIRTCAASRPEYRRQTGDARGMSSSIAAINVVGTHDAANEFLRRIV